MESRNAFSGHTVMAVRHCHTGGTCFVIAVPDLGISGSPQDPHVPHIGFIVLSGPRLISCQRCPTSAKYLCWPVGLPNASSPTNRSEEILPQPSLTDHHVTQSGPHAVARPNRHHLERERHASRPQRVPACHEQHVCQCGNCHRLAGPRCRRSNRY